MQKKHNPLFSNFFLNFENQGVYFRKISENKPNFAASKLIRSFT